MTVGTNSLSERYSGWFPISYEVSVDIDGGQFVVWDDANPGKVKPAPDHSFNVLGMAKYFASPKGEFDIQGGGAVRGVMVNSPIPRNVACPHVGCYDIFNVGDATLNPGDAVEIVGGASGAGKTGSGMLGGRAVVGTCLGLVSPGPLDLTQINPKQFSPKPTPVGQKFRIRLGRT